ncbi:MAG: ECF transporter S component [Coriobacteriia bacterium]|nr:ECF transporter S component [Coriobacteriia bacterium]MBS5477530.1 ECF transporter S component [Coriobacteriia bacterium]
MSTSPAPKPAGTTSAKTQARKNAAKRSHLDTRELVTIAIFAAMTMVLSFIQIPLFPPAPWLMYDPSGVIPLITALLFGPAAGVTVGVIGWLPRLFFDPLGTLITVVVVAVMSLITGLIYRAKKTFAGAMVGMVIGAVVFIVLAILLNLLITPLYAHVSIPEVAAMIVPILLPFNLIKVGLNVVITALLYKPVSNLIKRRDSRSHI